MQVPTVCTNTLNKVSNLNNVSRRPIVVNGQVFRAQPDSGGDQPLIIRCINRPSQPDVVRFFARAVLEGTNGEKRKVLILLGPTEQGGGTIYVPGEGGIEINGVSYVPLLGTDGKPVGLREGRYARFNEKVFRKLISTPNGDCSYLIYQSDRVLSSSVGRIYLGLSAEKAKSKTPDQIRGQLQFRNNCIDALFTGAWEYFGFHEGNVRAFSYAKAYGPNYSEKMVPSGISRVNLKARRAEVVTRLEELYQNPRPDLEWREEVERNEAYLSRIDAVLGNVEPGAEVLKFFGFHESEVGTLSGGAVITRADLESRRAEVERNLDRLFQNPRPGNREWEAEVLRNVRYLTRIDAVLRQDSLFVGCPAFRTSVLRLDKFSEEWAYYVLEYEPRINDYENLYSISTSMYGKTLSNNISRTRNYYIKKKEGLPTTPPIFAPEPAATPVAGTRPAD
jgi:hypothetical protein